MTENQCQKELEQGVELQNNSNLTPDESFLVDLTHTNENNLKKGLTSKNRLDTKGISEKKFGKLNLQTDQNSQKQQKLTKTKTHSEYFIIERAMEYIGIDCVRTSSF